MQKTFPLSFFDVPFTTTCGENNCVILSQRIRRFLLSLSSLETRVGGSLKLRYSMNPREHCPISDFVFPREFPLLPATTSVLKTTELLLPSLLTNIPTHSTHSLRTRVRPEHGKRAAASLKVKLVSTRPLKDKVVHCSPKVNCLQRLLLQGAPTAVHAHSRYKNQTSG